MTTKVSINNKLAIFSAAILGAGGIMIETSLNVTFPVLTSVFSTSLNNIQWVTTAYLLAATVAMTITAYLTKRFGVRTVWLWANLLFIVGTLMAGLAPTLLILLTGRILEGVSVGLAMPLLFNLILALVPKQRIGTWMGIGSMVISLAPSFGPTYGGAFVEGLGWRYIFFTLLIIPVCSLLLGWKTIVLKADEGKVPAFDFLAFVLLGVALVGGILATNQLADGHMNWITLVVTLAALIGFIYQSLHSRKTFLNIRLFAAKSFVLLFIPVVLYMFANLGLNLLLPNYLQDVHHTSSFLAGFSLLPGTLLGAILTPIFGNFYDRVGPQKLLWVGNAIFAVSLLLMALITDNMTFWVATVSYAVFTLGRNMAISTGITAGLESVTQAEQNDATAIQQAGQMFMGALGTTVAAMCGSISHGIAVGLQVFLWLLFILAILIFGMFWARGSAK